MPIYLIHGFKWVRRSIRIHIILQDVNEASADYLMQETTPIAMRASLTKLYPDIMKHLPDLQFIEQHDPEADGPDLAAQPYAFVADKVIESNLSISVEDAQVKNPISTETWGGNGRTQGQAGGDGAWLVRSVQRKRGAGGPAGRERGVGQRCRGM